MSNEEKSLRASSRGEPVAWERTEIPSADQHPSEDGQVYVTNNAGVVAVWKDNPLTKRIRPLYASPAEAVVTDDEYAWGLLRNTAESICRKLESETASVTALDQFALRGALERVAVSPPLLRDREITVKPLEWEKDGRDYWKAVVPWGKYNLTLNRTCQPEQYFWKAGLGMEWIPAQSIGEAEAAAQEHFNAAILSALVHPQGESNALLTPFQIEVLKRGADGRIIWVQDRAELFGIEMAALNELKRLGLVEHSTEPNPPGPPAMPAYVLTDAGLAALHQGDKE